LIKLHERTKAVAKNSIISIGLKGYSILISFILIPLYLQAVNTRQYGIILTITSIVQWLAFFDIGIGNGLRNKLGKALAEKDFDIAGRYVSTAYFYIGAFFTAFALIYICINPFLDWHRIINIKSNEIPNLNFLILIVVICFIFRFIFQLIGVVLLADIKNYINDTILPLSNTVVILMYYGLKVTHHLNFSSILISSSVAPLIIFLVYSTWFYLGKYNAIAPSIKKIDHGLRSDLLGLGIKFFAIQIVGVIIFSTSNFLIANLFDISNVTVFNIGYKYYNVVAMLFYILISPLWGAFTKAWYQKDFLWIEKSMKRSIKICVSLVLINLLQYLLYPIVSHYWLGKLVPINYLLVISFMIYNVIYSYNNIFAYFLNGIGEITVQLYCAIIGGVLNIPLTIFLAKYTNLGLSSIMFANVLCLLPSGIFTTIQSFNLLKIEKNKLAVQL
jgi:O-antigen/teichoic acid export membrane protein